MPADNELDPLDRWLKQQVAPLPPPPGTFELITRRARRRRIRKAVLTVASAAAVAAAVGVAVPLSTSLHLITPPTNAVAAGSTATPSGTAGSQSILSTGTQPQPAPSGTHTAQGGTGSIPGNATAPGSSSGASSPAYLPRGYVPTSVTWDSLSTGWVIGPAGTPGHCANANPDICTSIARTDDGGQHWQGVHAPDTGTGVTGLRFLNASYGWAFGPQLWATDDGGDHWHQVPTGSMSVPQLETVNGRAYALFANCRPVAGNQDAACSSYTLKTATAGSDQWTAVGGIASGLTGGPASRSPAVGQQDAAIIELADGTGKEPATGYLVAPDGTLYAGPLDGTAWHKVAKLPCAPGPGNGGGGQPQALQLAPAGASSSGAARLAMVCTATTSVTSVYWSDDNGATWTKQAGTGSLPSASIPRSLTTLPDGTLVLAALPRGAGSGGIYLLPPGATKWQPASLAHPSGRTYGFTYVGMTGPTQGVALGGDPNLHAIWMTTDGGKTWQVRPIQR